jgi:hypothetical protein
MLKYILSLAGSYQGPVLAKDAILLDKTRAVLWHNYKNRIWQKEREKKTEKKINNEMTESDTSPARASG